MANLDLDITTVSVRALLADAAFTALVTQEIVGKNPLAQGDDPWVFQGLDDEGRPRVDPEGTGKAVVVLSAWDDWGGSAQQTRRFPVLQALIFADSSRDAAGAVTKQDARRRCAHVAKRVEDVFHDAANEFHQWPGLFVHSSRRASGLSIRDVPGTQSNVVRGELRFEVAID